MKNIVNRVPDPDEMNARVGIIAPKPILLDADSYIYRFASHTAIFGYHASTWWILHKDFDTIVRRANRAGVDLGQKARWDISVLPRWNKMNVAVEARVSGRIWAWTGLAKLQQQLAPNGKVIRMFGNPGIKQLYLCGVVDRFGMLTPAARYSLSITGAKSFRIQTFFNIMNHSESLGPDEQLV